MEAAAAIHNPAAFASPAPRIRAGRTPIAASAAALAIPSDSSSRDGWQTACAILSSTPANPPAPKVNGQTTKLAPLDETTNAATAVAATLLGEATRRARHRAHRPRRLGLHLLASLLA